MSFADTPREAANLQKFDQRYKFSGTDKQIYRQLGNSANAFDEDRKKALQCGMNGFLSKPIVIEELISTLQNSLG